ncbi:MAG TPA: BlaI/MecI/CopY family transcriptional regulator [Longimicrobium sp.]|jgi:predicted transcriptional regulator
MSEALTPAQLAIMNVLWDRGEATAAEVHEALRAERDVAATTVATMLTRLERKGVVAHRTEGRQFVYRACTAREDVRESVLGSFVEHLFAGDVALAVSHLLARDEVSPDELARVRRMIDAREREIGEGR